MSASTARGIWNLLTVVAAIGAVYFALVLVAALNG